MRNTVQVYVDGNRLDLFKDEQIVLRNQIKDIRDVKKIFSPFSHTFKVPASKQNNKIFKHVLRTDNAELDPRKYFEAVIEVNNAEFRRGYIKLDKSHEIKSGTIYSYSLRFFDKFVQIAQLLGEVQLDQIESLSPYSEYLSNLQRHSLIKAAPDGTVSDYSGEDVIPDVVKDNMRYVLNSYDGVFFYDTDPSYSDGSIDADTIEANQIGGVEQSKLRNIADVSDAVSRTSDGIRPSRMFPSLKMDAILKGIEDKVWYNGGPKLKFSRGLDSNGKPTSNIDNVVEGDEHFFGTDAWTEAFMLLKTKSNDVASGGTIEWDNQWLDHNLDDGDSKYLIATNPYYTNRDNHQDYWLYMRLTTSNTDTPYAVQLFEERTGKEIYNKGGITGSHTIQGPTPNGFGSGGGVTKIENNSQYLTGDNVVEVGDTDVPGDTMQYTRRYGEQQWGIRIITEEGAKLTFSKIEVTIISEEEDNALFRSFSRRVRFQENEVSDLTVGSANIPKIKILDWLTGVFKMFNLVAYYSTDNNGEDIIVVDTLKNFYENGKSRNVTKYVDSQDITLTTPKVYSDIQFKFQDAQTIAMKGYKDNTTQSYGDLGHNLREDEEGNVLAPFLPKNEYKIELPFEQALLQEVNTAEASKPNLYYNLLTGDSYEDTDVKPIVHYIRHETTTGTANLLYKDEVGNKLAVTDSKDYNIMTPFLRDDSDNIIQTLTFGEEEDIIFPQDEGEDKLNTLFGSYWEDYIVESFRNKAYVYSFNGRLSHSVLNELTLGDSLIIGDNEYRINKYSHNLNDGRNTLELVSLNDPSITVGQAPEAQADDGILTNTIAINSFTITPSVNITDEVSSITLTVSASGGNGDLSYAWYKNGTVVSGETGTSLTQTTFADDDAFYVVVSDEANFTRQTQTLTLNVVTETLSALALTNNAAIPYAGGDETITVSGDNGTEYYLTLSDVSPAGWVSIDDANSSSGTISGGSNTHTLSFDRNLDTDSTRTATLNVFNSAAIEDTHTVSITQQMGVPTFTATYDLTLSGFNESDVTYTLPDSITDESGQPYSFTDPTISPASNKYFTSGPTFSGDALSGTLTADVTVERTATGTVANKTTFTFDDWTGSLNNVGASGGKPSVASNGNAASVTVNTTVPATTDCAGTSPSISVTVEVPNNVKYSNAGSTVSGSVTISQSGPTYTATFSYTDSITGSTDGVGYTLSNKSQSSVTGCGIAYSFNDISATVNAGWDVDTAFATSGSSLTGTLNSNVNVHRTITGAVSTTLYTATYDLSFSGITASDVTFTNPEDQAGANGDSYSFTDPTVTAASGKYFTTSPSFSGDSLTGIFNLSNVTVGRTVTAAVADQVAFSADDWTGSLNDIGSDGGTPTVESQGNATSVTVNTNVASTTNCSGETRTISVTLGVPDDDKWSNAGEDIDVDVSISQSGPTYTVSFEVTNNITGPTDGYVLGNTSQEDQTGCGTAYSFTKPTATANEGYEFTTGPSFGGDALSGTINSDDTVTVTVSGEVEVTDFVADYELTLSGFSASDVTYTNPADQTGENGDSYSFTDPNITPVSGKYFTSGPTFSGDALSGTFGSDDVTVSRTATGTIANTSAFQFVDWDGSVNDIGSGGGVPTITNGSSGTGSTTTNVSATSNCSGASPTVSVTVQVPNEAKWSNAGSTVTGNVTISQSGPTYTVGFSGTNNISGPAAGYTVSNLVQSQQTGCGTTYTFLDITASVNDDYQVETAFTTSGDSLTGTFNSNTTINRSISGAVSEIPNAAPTAVITGLSTGVAGTQVNLSGTSSSDSDGSIASYTWRVISGGCTLTSTSASTTGVNRTSAGTCSIGLVVTDDESLDSAEDTHSITFAAACHNWPATTRNTSESNICNDGLMYGTAHYGNGSNVASSTSYYNLNDSSCGTLQSGTYYLRQSGSDTYYTSTNGSISAGGTCTS